MIKGVGIDIIEIKRFDNLIKRYGDKFLKRIFTKNEIEYAKKRKNAESFAGMFAAKEAYIKACGTKKLEFNEIEIIHDKNNKPLYKLNFRTDYSLNLSISHNKTSAIAICIID
ncbi:MAG TPA: holo-[acyl-carrier-protein] synthase [Bacteroidetes bacterium]|uniref:Holo-[acyl-carrier-protein] synthase n=1 Tax=candidate division TA06 bacterium TaxID=2250710 RepID=A0A660S5C8_UNCT6|nr:MAG: holo-[acyl-carrier-protein] synthase [candidate division TA06 bacterium]HHD82615.1 holo-[acyl-carrier-protein] synthase [Bacteroidota bacterium]